MFLYLKRNNKKCIRLRDLRSWPNDNTVYCPSPIKRETFLKPPSAFPMYGLCFVGCYYEERQAYHQMLVNSQSWTIEGTERKIIYQGISLSHGWKKIWRKRNTENVCVRYEKSCPDKVSCVLANFEGGAPDGKAEMDDDIGGRILVNYCCC